MIYRYLTILCLFTLLFTAFAGCAHQNIARSSSSIPLSELIEPVKDSRYTDQKTPLILPASVAIVTVPSGYKNRQNSSYIPNTTFRQAGEKLKQQLLDNPKYVKSVSVVSMEDINYRISLERIRSMYAADIVIILSYMQDQRSTQSGAAGLMDATIAGAFLVPGVVTKTSSIINGQVIHIPSNAIIFRANGKDERSKHSTSYSVKGAATEESIAGILAATTDFGNSLIKTLSNFNNYDLSQAVPVSALTEGNSRGITRGKPSNDYWTRVDNYKSTGGGAFGIVLLLITAVVCFAGWRSK